MERVHLQHLRCLDRYKDQKGLVAYGENANGAGSGKHLGQYGQIGLKDHFQCSTL